MTATVRTAKVRWVERVLLVATLSMVACSSPEENEGTQETLLVGTWYSAPGELESFQEIVNDFKADAPDVLVDIVPISLEPGERLEQYHGDAKWDMGVQMAPFMGGMTDVVVDLNGISELESLKGTIDPLLAGVMEQESKWLGVPLSIHRLNTLIYDLDSLATLGFDHAPSTIQEYTELCEAYVDGGKVGPKPLGTGGAADPRSLLLFVVGFLPKEVVFGTAEDPLPAMQEVFALLDMYLENDCLHQVGDENESGVSWDDSMQDFIDGKAAMVVEPPWAVGLLVANGRFPGIDFRTASPLAESPYVYTAEFLTVNAETKSLSAATKFLARALNLQTQLDFTAIRGSIPAVTIDDPETTISNAGTKESYLEYVSALEDGRVGPMAPWIGAGPKPPTFLTPYFAGSMTSAEAIDGFLCTEPTYPDFPCD